MQLREKVHLRNPVSYRCHDLTANEVEAARDAIELAPVAIKDYNKKALEKLLTVVEKNKVTEIVVTRMEPNCYGSHGHQGNSGSIQINGRLAWHKSGTYSTVAMGESPIEVIQLALVHEIGHFLARRYESQVFGELEPELNGPNGERKGVTEYARECTGEYFSETLVAVTLLPKLRMHDRGGFDAVLRLLESWAE